MIRQVNMPFRDPLSPQHDNDHDMNVLFAWGDELTAAFNNLTEEVIPAMIEQAVEDTTTNIIELLAKYEVLKEKARNT